MKTVTVKFDGLLLFCFPTRGATMQTHCEVKVLTETGGDPHEVVIDWREAGGTGTHCREFSQQDLRKIGWLLLYLDAGRGFEPPAPDGVQIRSFDLLDLQGAQFYGPDAKIKSAAYGASLFVTQGNFDGVNRSDKPIHRVSRRVFNEIIPRQRDPKRWPRLEPDEKYDLPEYHRSAEARISLNEGQSLVLLKGDDKREVFRLRFADIGANPKVVISNLDKRNPNPTKEAGCKAFLHHAAAFTHAGRPDWGLWPDNFVPRVFETESGCCECAKASETSAQQLPIELY